LLLLLLLLFFRSWFRERNGREEHVVERVIYDAGGGQMNEEEVEDVHFEKEGNVEVGERGEEEREREEEGVSGVEERNEDRTQDFRAAFYKRYVNYGMDGNEAGEEE
jgi:hypothetical protein